MYDPVTARFLQEDTYRGDRNDPLSLNLYTYCHNEPMMYTDPTGHLRQGETLSYNPNKYSSDVKKMQAALKDLGCKIKVDGYFGDETLKAVNTFKTNNKLQNNTKATAGIVGATTWQWLGLKLDTISTTSNSKNSSSTTTKSTSTVKSNSTQQNGGSIVEAVVKAPVKAAANVLEPSVMWSALAGLEIRKATGTISKEEYEAKKAYAWNKLEKTGEALINAGVNTVNTDISQNTFTKSGVYIVNNAGVILDTNASQEELDALADNALSTAMIINGLGKIGSSVTITSTPQLSLAGGGTVGGSVAVTFNGSAAAVGAAEMSVGMTGGGGNKEGNGQTRMTNKQATEVAKELGYEKTNYISNGQPVFKKGNRYITPDVDSHNGGIWKMADSVKNLGSRKSRMGTYNANLERIGD